MNTTREQQSAQQRDAVLQASIDFISTLTGMTPPPIEVAPPEVFAPFKDFADQVCAIFAQPLAPVSDRRCACVFQGDKRVEQCELHAAWEETLHDQAKELKHLRAAVAKAGGAAPSPAWCASVDAELAATADADARKLAPTGPDDVQMRSARSKDANDWRRPDGGLERAEYLMRTYPGKYQMRKLYVAEQPVALESSVGHLSALVDELRRLLGAAMQTMSELHVSAEPDESTADIDARIPGAAFAKFVNEHAQLLFEIKNGCAAEPAPSLPAAAVAEGAQLDGESLEPSE